jgi:hypothetical protein
MKMKYIVSIILFLCLITIPVMAIASNITGADYKTTIKITNNGTAVSNGIVELQLDTQTMIDADMLDAAATDCAIQDGNNQDVAFMPAPPGSDNWSIYVPSIGEGASYNNLLYSNDVTGGKICMFLDTGMTIADDSSYELADNYTLKVDNVRLISSSDNIIAYKPDAYALTYDSTSVKYETLTLQQYYGRADSTPLSYYGKDTVVTNRYLASITGQATELRVKWGAGTSGTLKYAIYTSSGTTPGTKLISGTSGTMTPNTINTINLANPVDVVSGTYYWIATNASVDGAAGYTASGDGVRRWKAETYSTYTFPDTWSDTGYTGDTNGSYYSAWGTCYLEAAVSAGEHDIEVRTVPVSPIAEYTLRPEAEGDKTQIQYSTGVNHYTEVDDTTTDENSSYVYTDTSVVSNYYTDLFEIPTTTFNTISGVTVYARCKALTVSGCNIVIKTGGNEYAGDYHELNSSSWVTYSYTWSNNPNTSTAWTQVDIDDLQIGLKLRGGGALYYSGACTQCYALVSGEIPAYAAQLLIDNSLVDTSAAVLTVPDSGDDTIVGSGCTAYIGEFSTAADGLDTCVINWEYDTTFHDDTLNGNDATPSLRSSPSDPDLYASIVSQQALDVSTGPTTTPAGWQMIPTTISTPGGLFNEGGYSFPGGSTIKKAAEDMGYDYVSWLMFFAFGCAIAAFVGIFKLTYNPRKGAKGSLLMAILAAEGVLIFFYIVHTIPGWCLIPGGIIMVLLLLWKKSTAPVD